MNSQTINLLKDNYYVYMTVVLSTLLVLRVFFIPLNNNAMIDLCFLISFSMSIPYLIKSIKTGVILSFWGTWMANGIYVLLMGACITSAAYLKVYNPDNFSSDVLAERLILWHSTATCVTAVFLVLMTMVNQALFRSMKNEPIQVLKTKTKEISNQKFNVLFKGNHSIYKIGNYQCFDEGIMIENKLITFVQLKDFLSNIGKNFDSLEKEDMALIDMYFIE